MKANPDVVRSRFDSIPRLSLGSFPSEVRCLTLDGGRSFWVKDDGICSDLYGGNKVRKLEYILADARGRDAHTLVLRGDVGSHTVRACSLWGKRAGFELWACVYRHGRDPHCAEEMAHLQETGAHVRVSKNLLASLLHAFLLDHRSGAYPIPLGASSPIGILGHVRAILELDEQVRCGAIPAPERIYIAFGSGGSVAGILIGLALVGMPGRVVAVQCTERIIANAGTTRRQVEGALRLFDPSLSHFAEAMGRLHHIDRRFLGSGYHDRPLAAMESVWLASTLGLELEPVFTGKAMAALLSDLKPGSRAPWLFWNTHHRSAPDLRETRKQKRPSIAGGGG